VGKTDIEREVLTTDDDKEEEEEEDWMRTVGFVEVAKKGT
jgi:hypothetical protein